MEAVTLKSQWQIFLLRSITQNDVTCSTTAFFVLFLIILQAVLNAPKGLKIKKNWQRKPKLCQKVTVIARKFFIKSAKYSNCQNTIVMRTFESHDRPNCFGYVLEKVKLLNLKSIASMTNVRNGLDLQSSPSCLNKM